MAAGNIKYSSIVSGYSNAEGYFIKGIIQFTYNSKYYLTDESVRVFYTTTPGQSNADYVDIVPPGTSSSDDHAIEAELWQEPYNQLGKSMKDKFRKPTINLDCSHCIVGFTIKNLSPNSKYYTTAWLRLFNSKGAFKTSVRDPEDKNTRYEIETMTYKYVRPLFQVATYEQVVDSNDNEVYGINYADFTDCIKLPSYDVNSEDINEDWEDADYRTHRIVTRRKVNGKFEMIFPTIERQKEFFHLLDISKELNGDGNAYVELEVHLNNVLDFRTGIDMSDTHCINYKGKFFIKIDNNAWVQPIYGHYDKYSPLSVTIQEA